MKTLSIILCFFIGLSLQAQEDERIGLDMTLGYAIDANGIVTLRAEVYDEEEYEPVMDMDFKFFAISEDEELLLGTAQSNEEAIIELSDLSADEIPKSSSNLMTFKLVGENEQYFGELVKEVQHVSLRVAFELNDDSVQLVSVYLTSMEDGVQVGVPDGEVYLFIPRLFGDLPIGDVWTDDDGYDKLKFPTDIPGDVDGNVEVIARIIDSDEMGSIESRNTSDWAKPKATNGEIPRALWSGRPPIWMIVTFNLLMIGVIAHYGWIVVNLLRIRKLGSK
ncbi:MAG: hypothetical protein JXQ90_12155 [Cyclobacteriaceae bacterium]